MDIGQFLREMECIAPAILAEEFDEGKIGLVVEGRREINTICCALDATPYVIEQAVSRNADALVIHHTPIWQPVTRIEGSLARLLLSILSAGLNIYVMHTNFDHAEGGINDTLADILKLNNKERMSLGIVGDCTLPLDEILRLIGGNVRIFGTLPALKRLAVVGGSGFDPSLVEEARLRGADAFLSSELKHNVERTASLPLIESTHYALEAPGMCRLAERMGWEFIDDPPQMVIVE
jgi:dinuclear metal center YbgI/SA1388 family protein